METVTIGVTVVFMGQLLLALPSASQEAVVLAPIEGYHTPVLLLDADHLALPFDPQATGLKLRRAFTPDGKEGYEINLTGWDLRFSGGGSSPKPHYDGSPTSRPQGSDWHHLDYVPHLKDLDIQKYRVDPKYLEKELDSASVRMRFWLGGGAKISAMAPPATFLTALWECFPNDLSDCKWNSGVKQGLTDRFVVEGFRTLTVDIRDPREKDQNVVAAHLHLRDGARLWVVGRWQGAKVPDTTNGLPHIYHYLDLIKPSPSPRTLRRAGIGAGPVFCPAMVASY